MNEVKFCVIYSIHFFKDFDLFFMDTNFNAQNKVDKLKSHFYLFALPQQGKTYLNSYVKPLSDMIHPIRL